MTPHELGLTKVAYGVRETLELLSIGKTTLFRLVREGQLHRSKLGRKTLFLASDIAKLLDELK